MVTESVTELVWLQSWSGYRGSMVTEVWLQSWYVTVGVVTEVCYGG